MINDLWINLPVKDLAKSITFYQGIGFALNAGPGNGEHSACFVIGKKKIVLMLFVEKLFVGFTDHALSDPAAGTEVLFSLGVETRAQVDEMAQRAKSAGGRVYGEPRESNGFMYGCGVIDPDGHRWNALYMDPGKMPNSQAVAP